MTLLNFRVWSNRERSCYFDSHHLNNNQSQLKLYPNGDVTIWYVHVQNFGMSELIYVLLHLIWYRCLYRGLPARNLKENNHPVLTKLCLYICGIIFFKISLYLVTLLVFPSSLAIIQVHKSSWYMLHYGGPTPKRHYAFSNSRWVAKLDLGKLRGWAQRKKVLKSIGKGYDLVDHYIDAQGKKRWKGNRLLRSSELGA